MTTIQQIADRWEYIQGGFTYIDSNGQSKTTADTVGLSASELRGFIESLHGAVTTAKGEIVSRLIPEATPREFGDLPLSFQIMLDCDNAYLQTALDTPLDSQFGSVAIALLYRDVAAWCGVKSSVPEMMLNAIAARTGKSPVTSD